MIRQAPMMYIRVTARTAGRSPSPAGIALFFERASNEDAGVN
jgi:hypothetical protein